MSVAQRHGRRYGFALDHMGTPWTSGMGAGTWINRINRQFEPCYN